MSQYNVDKVQALMQQLDRAEARAHTLPPVWQKGEQMFENTEKNKYPEHVKAAMAAAVEDASRVPPDQRVEYMGNNMLSRLRGELPAAPKQKTTTHKSVLFSTSSTKDSIPTGISDIYELRNELVGAAEMARMKGKFTSLRASSCLSSASNANSAFALNRGGVGPDTTRPEERRSSVRLNGMQVKTTAEGKDYELKQLGAPNDRLDLTDIHRMMSDAERLPADSGVAPRSRLELRRAARQAKEDRVVPRPPRGPVRYDHKTFAQATAEAGDNMLHAHMFSLTNGSNEQRHLKDEEKDLSAERRRELREMRVVDAEEARIEYGPTTKERQLKKKSDENLEKQSLEGLRYDAQNNFKRGYYRVVITCIANLVTTVLFQVSEFPKTAIYKADGSYEDIPGAPFQATISTAMGTVGSALLLLDFSLIRLILKFQGPRSKALIKLTPFFVYVQYVSLLLQVSCFSGFTFYLIDGLVARMITRFNDSNGLNSFLTVIRMILAFLLPPLMGYSILEGRRVCLKNMQYMGERPRVVQRHFFIAIRFCLGFSSIAFVVQAFLRTFVFFDQVLGTSVTYPGTQSENITKGFETVASLTYPFLQFAFPGSSFEEMLYGCNYSIPVDPMIDLEQVEVSIGGSGYRYNRFLGENLRADYDVLVAAVDSMVAQFVSQSNECGVNAAMTGATLNATAIWHFITDPQAYMTEVASGASANSSFNYFLPLLIGFVCIGMSFFFSYVSLNFLKYEKENNEFPQLLIDVKTAGQRVQLLEGKQVVINHMVDKPKLNKMRGKLVGDGFNAAGQVGVKLADSTGTVVFVEEWNLSKGDYEGKEEAEQAKERAGLRAAEARYLHETKGRKLGGFEKIYTVMCQVITGFSIHGLLTFLTTSKYAGISGYAVLAQASGLDQSARNVYSKQTCREWLQCVRGHEADFCGDCSYALPSGMSLSDFLGELVPTDMAEFFNEDNMGTVVTWVSIFGGTALLLVLFMAKVVGQTGWCLAFVASIVACIPLSFAGLGFWVFDGRYWEDTPTYERVCDNPEAFWAQVTDPPAVDGQNPMELTCILQVSITTISERTNSLAFNALYLGFMVNQFFFLLDSTFTLSSVLSSLRGANEFAKFELSLFMNSFVVAMIVLILFRFVNSVTEFATYLSLSNYRFVMFAQRAYEEFGRSDLWSKYIYATTTLSPIDADQALSDVNNSVGYGSFLSLILLIGITGVQFIGMYINYMAKDQDLEDSPTLLSLIRFVLLFDILFFSSYILFQIILALDSPWIIVMVGILFLIPLAFQIVFVTFYALSSDILQAKSKLFRNASGLIVWIQAFPLVAIICTTMGLALVVDHKRIQAMAQGAGLPLFLGGLSGFTVFCLASFYLFRSLCVTATKEWVMQGFQKLEDEVRRQKAKAEAEMLAKMQAAKVAAKKQANRARGRKDEDVNAEESQELDLANLNESGT